MSEQARIAVARVLARITTEQHGGVWVPVDPLPKTDAQPAPPPIPAKEA